MIASDVESIVRTIAGVDPRHVAACPAARPDGQPSTIIAFAPRPDASAEVTELSARIGDAVAARFGLRPRLIMPLRPDRRDGDGGHTGERDLLEEQIASGGLDPINETLSAGTPVAHLSPSDDEVELEWRTRIQRDPSEVSEFVLTAFRQHFASEALAPDDNFFERGGDSTQAMLLVNAISRGVGAQIPTDILFRYPTPRQLAAFLQPAHAGAGWDVQPSVVTFNRHRDGRPVFLVPALYPSPWVFLPLVEAMNLARPIYGLRSPELDWRQDVLDVGEMVVHYVAEIRRLQPRGPYSVIGYSFGGLVAFEVANRLARDEEVRDLILLDTAGPPTLADRLRRPFRDGALLLDLLANFSRKRLIGVGTLSLLGINSPTNRAALPFTAGPLAFAELHAALRLVNPDVPSLESLNLEELCAALLATVRALASREEWAAAERFVPLHSEDPVSAVKAYKVLAKNLWFSRRYRPSGVFPGAITVFASEQNPKVVQWQAYSSRPLNVIWVAARGYRGARAHVSFLDPRNVHLYVGELTEMLDEGNRRERKIA